MWTGFRGARDHLEPDIGGQVGEMVERRDESTPDEAVPDHEHHVPVA